MMSLLPFCALNMAALLLSMQGQKDLIKYFNLCFDDEWGLVGLKWHEGD